eukprot:889246-Alexandrium_andersonii.AAC.1
MPGPPPAGSSAGAPIAAPGPWAVVAPAAAPGVGVAAPAAAPEEGQPRKWDDRQRQPDRSWQ